MRSPSSRASLFGIAFAVFTAGSCASAFASISLPELTGSTTRSVGIIAGHQRTFWLYVPRDLKPNAALIFVLHGGGGDGPTILEGTGHEFDILADRYGFVVVYPDGIGRSWNHCRKLPTSDAKRLRVDDIAFFDAIITREVQVHGIDKKRVFATGHSNGGQMAYRLALEHPDTFAAVAAISSNLPSGDNMDCTPTGKGVPVMIMNGTADPVSPYNGGTGGVALADLGNNILGIQSSGGGRRGNQRRGAAMSTEATAQYFAKRNGLTSEPERVRLPHINPSDRTSVERVTWSEPGKPSVILYSIIGGGHVVPQPYWDFPRVVGAQTQDVDAPAVIWDFFSKLPPNP